MEKQIDEMAKDLCHTDTCEIKKIGIPCNHRCKAHIYAARAIDKGYRKASEVAEEIFAEIEEGIKAAVSALQFENNPIHRSVKHETYSSMMRFIKTIQEKHTEEGK